MSVEFKYPVGLTFNFIEDKEGYLYRINNREVIDSEGSGNSSFFLRYDIDSVNPLDSKGGFNISEDTLEKIINLQTKGE